MNSKQYLSQLFFLDKQIKLKIEQSEHLMELAKSATRPISPIKIKSSKDISNAESQICGYLDIQDELKRDIEKMIRLKREIEACIEKVENPLYKLILSLRYANFKTWEEIAQSLNYSYRNVIRLHRKGLEMIELYVIECHDEVC